MTSKLRRAACALLLAACATVPRPAPAPVRQTDFAGRPLRSAPHSPDLVVGMPYDALEQPEGWMFVLGVIVLAIAAGVTVVVVDGI